MSYDLQLIRPRPGESISETAMRDMERDPAPAPDPAKEALKRKVADALVSADPQLKIFRIDHAAIARQRKISREQAEREFRDIELNDESVGIQITLFDDEAGISVPYWHQGEKAQSVMRRVLAAADLICRETGYVAYDPQIEEVVTTSDVDTILPLYVGHVAAAVQKMGVSAVPRRPWWKFW